MKVGLVGFRGVGKTTMFSALSGLLAGAQHKRPDKPHLGVIKVPDPRLETLAKIYQPRKVTPAEMCFVDFAGRGTSTRTALDVGLVAQMREIEAFVLVLRGFDDGSGEPPAPVREFGAFCDELLLADLAVVEKRLERLRKEKGSEQEKRLLERCHLALEDGQPIRRLSLREDEERALSPFALVSLKPLLVVLNVAEADVARPVPPELLAETEDCGIPAMAVCGQVEMEVGELAEVERDAYLRELGIAESARSRFIQASYRLLSLMSFLTGGADEVRAWPIREGTTALRAAGKIHSDIERGFIRAEVIRFEDLVAHGSEARCRDAGDLRIEGRDYVVRDGDVMNFRFAV